MKNNNITYLTSILLVVSTSLAFIGFISKGASAASQLVSNKSNAILREDKVLKLKSTFWENYSALIIPCDNKLIAASVIITDTGMKKFTIQQLTKGKCRLVFRYSSNDCELCVNSILNIIKEELGKRSGEIPLIITDSYSTKDYIVKTRYLNYFLTIYDLQDPLQGLGLPLENKNLPFLFVLGADHKATKIFIPFKEEPEKTKEYLTLVSDYIYRENNNSKNESTTPIGY